MALMLIQMHHKWLKSRFIRHKRYGDLTFGIYFKDTMKWVPELYNDLYDTEQEYVALRYADKIGSQARTFDKFDRALKGVHLVSNDAVQTVFIIENSSGGHGTALLLIPDFCQRIADILQCVVLDLRIVRISYKGSFVVIRPSWVCVDIMYSATSQDERVVYWTASDPEQAEIEVGFTTNTSPSWREMIQEWQANQECEDSPLKTLMQLPRLTD